MYNEPEIKVLSFRNWKEQPEVKKLSIKEDLLLEAYQNNFDQIQNEYRKSLTKNSIK